MNIKNYMKEQLDNVSDKLILEAANTTLDYHYDGQIYYIKESIMDKIKKITSFAACFLLVISTVVSFILIRESITNDNYDTMENENDPSYIAALKTAETLFTLDLTENEIAFIEDLTRKDFDTLTPKEVLAIRSVNIIGNHARLEKGYGAIGQTYYIDYQEYDVGLDYSDEIYLLKYFPNIVSLSLSHQIDLTDVNFLKDLVYLEEFRLSGTKVTDLSVLDNHPDLKTLEIKLSPVSKIIINKDAELQHVSLVGIDFGDVSYFKRHKDINNFSVCYLRVPVIGIETLTEFKELNYLEVVGEDVDFSFLKEIKAELFNLSIGGVDDLDLTMVAHLLPDLNYFSLYDSDGTDLRILDLMEESADISICNSVLGEVGDKTSEENECFHIYDENHSIKTIVEEYYEKFLN